MGIGGVDFLFVVQIPGPKGVQVLQHLMADFKALRMGDLHLAQREFLVLLAGRRTVAQGIVPHEQGDGGPAVGGQGIGLESIETLVEAIVTHIAQQVLERRIPIRDDAEPEAPPL